LYRNADPGSQSDHQYPGSFFDQPALLRIVQGQGYGGGSSIAAIGENLMEFRYGQIAEIGYAFKGSF